MELERRQTAIELQQQEMGSELVQQGAEVARAHTRLDTLAPAVTSAGEAGEVVRALQLRVYGPYQVVSEAQAAELAESVKKIAHTLTEQDPKGGNYYQSVWSELHRRYSVMDTIDRSLIFNNCIKLPSENSRQPG